MYYLTGTTPNPGDKRELPDKYVANIVGQKVRIWKSPDLKNWEYIGEPYSLGNTYDALKNANIDVPELKEDTPLWAPEIHWTGKNWLLVHCPRYISTFAISKTNELNGQWSNPSPKDFIGRHDGSLFKDDNNKWYYTFQNAYVAPIKSDFSGLEKEPVYIGPSDRKIGHEGATIIKIKNKYVLFGTGWSVGKGRKGSYNLYYCTADSIYGPYSKRRFAGRFMGHGTPFMDKNGKWWCTAFYNANLLIPDNNIQTRDLSDNAYSINKLGVTIVPLDIKEKDNDIFIKAIDPKYGIPGPDEAQKFECDAQGFYY